MEFWEEVMAWLDENPGRHTYGEVAKGMGRDPTKYGQAMGSAMRAIHNRNHHDYCVRVVDPDTGRHGCSTPPE